MTLQSLSTTISMTQIKGSDCSFNNFIMLGTLLAQINLDCQLAFVKLKRNKIFVQSKKRFSSILTALVMILQHRGGGPI